jgi:hypothetical protein
MSSAVTQDQTRIAPWGQLKPRVGIRRAMTELGQNPTFTLAHHRWIFPSPALVEHFQASAPFSTPVNSRPLTPSSNAQSRRSLRSNQFTALLEAQSRGAKWAFFLACRVELD